MKHKLKLIIAPYGAGSHFLGYIQSILLRDRPIEDIHSRERNLWDFSYVMAFDPAVRNAEKEGIRLLSDKQKILKQKISNLDTLGEPVIRKFSQYTNTDLELNFHIYPFGIEEYFDPEVVFFLTMNKERFFWCWQLADLKHQEDPRDSWKADADKEWLNHLQIKEQLTDSSIIFDYEDLFTIQNKETIKRFINVSKLDNIWLDIDTLCKMFHDYNKHNEQMLPW